MLVANASNNQTIVPSSSVRLRRSRRLSSTRGLKQRSTANPPKNQKSGFSGTVSKNVAENDIIGKPPINWEMNERISLSSGSSIGLAVRPDTKRGIEFSEIENRRKINECTEQRRNNAKSSFKPTLTLMNVSGFSPCVDQKHHCSRLIDTTNENVIKSDSKYESGISSCTSTTRMQIGQDELGRKDNVVVATTGKLTKNKLDDSIKKRLELIHELNQRILVNYERFQQKSKRVLKDTREQTSKSRGKNTTNAEEHIYSEIKRKNKTSDSKRENIFRKDTSNRDTTKDSLKRDTSRKINIGKFTFSKNYRCGNISANDRTEEKIFSSDTSESNRRIICENTNFSMAAKENFGDQTDEKIQYTIYSKSNDKKERLSDGSTVFYINEDLSENEIESTSPETCLENSKLYPDNYNLSNNKLKDNDSTKEKEQINSVNYDEYNLRKDDRSRMANENVILDERIPEESKILENLDKTIDKFDSEKTQLTSGDSNEDSFSTDSIQSQSPSSAKKSRDSNLLDTFNSSWDSGVGADVGNGSGWVRIHTGIESSLVYLTLDTTAKDVCRDMLLGDNLSLFVQVNDNLQLTDCVSLNSAYQHCA